MKDQPLSLNAVFVAWRDPVHHRCYPVGRLARLAGPGSGRAYEFVYVQGVSSAKEAGFSHIVPFEDLHSIYRSAALFPFFMNRIMSESRSDRDAFLQRMMLTQPDPLEILSRTGGIRATDSFEVFPLPRLDPSMPGFRTLFFVHALRHFPASAHQRIALLQPGEVLYMVMDCQNEFDPLAIALRTADRVLVGHVPGYLLMGMYELRDKCADICLSVAQVNLEPAPLDQRLLCEMETCWPPDYRPFVDDRFQPIAQGAIRTESLIDEYDGGVPVEA